MKRRLKILLSLLIITLLLLVSFKLFVKNNEKKLQIPVLMYHNIVLDEYYKKQADTITVSTFEKQLEYLKENNYKTLTLDEFYCWKNNQCDLNGNLVLLTFDDGFYSFHHLGEPLLKKYNFHAVNFLIGDATSEITKEYNPEKYGTIGIDLINNSSEYVEYQSHSYAMHHLVNNKQKVYTMNKSEIDQDIKNMHKNLNHEFHYLSYPYNTDTDDFIEALKENGYRLAFRGEAEKATRDANNYQIPRIGVSNDLDHYKSIFETKKYNNRYGNGFIRKVLITIERKFKIRLS